MVENNKDDGRPRDTAEFESQFASYHSQRCAKIDHLFQYVLVLQWIGGIILTVVVAPYTWIGAQSQVHEHLWLAVFGGGALASLPIYLIRAYPGDYRTRMVISTAQALFSCMLIHLSGGRIETHFHVFGSLAFLAMYCDWRVLVPATLLVATDHFIRGVFWPETVFGLATVSLWRCLEHVAWLMFENTFLYLMIRQNVSEMQSKVRNTIELKKQITENSRLSLFASHSRHSCIITDPNGVALWTNDVFTKLTGYQPHEMIGRKPGRLLQGRDTNRAMTAKVSAAIRNQKPVSAELLNYSKSGEPYWIVLDIDPVFDADGKLIHFIATQTDISEKIAREQQLVQARKDAEAANLAKSQFLANMSHEIRTPLNGILGFTELLVRDPHLQPETRNEYLETIHSSGSHLQSLINDILDLSKIEAGQMQISIAPCSPHNIMSQVETILRGVAESKNLYLDFRWNTMVPETIKSDQLRLKQLLVNLVSNAIKFTQYGGVDVIASFICTGNRGVLSFEVRDTGIGIEPDKQEAIFRPFTQADDTVTRKFGGTGLGLAISRSIAELLGGSLRVHSQPGRGSTFTAEMAVEDVQQVTLLVNPPEIAAEKPLAGSHCFDGARVLVVDDSEINRKLVTYLLEEVNATVKCAVNGADALRLATQSEFDLVLMDIQMPIMDGYTATKELIDRGFRMPIVALTAHAMQGDHDRCMEAGCSGYVSKPIVRDHLMDVIAYQLETHRNRVAYLPQASAMSATSAASAMSPTSAASAMSPTSAASAAELARILSATKEPPHDAKPSTPSTSAAYPSMATAATQASAAAIADAGTAWANPQPSPAATNRRDGNSSGYGNSGGYGNSSGLGYRNEYGYPNECANLNEYGYPSRYASSDEYASANEYADPIRYGYPNADLNGIACRDKDCAADASANAPANVTANAAANGLSDTNEGANDVPEARKHQHPYRSTILKDYPQLRSTVVDFTHTLSQQLDLIENALASEDFGSVARAAHLLKGSGGSVGFNCITRPAAEMEMAAMSEDRDAITPLLEELQTIQDLVVVDED